MAKLRRERRSSGLIRVPFVRVCHLDFEGEAEPRRAFIVNINILGAYVAGCRGATPKVAGEVIDKFHSL